MPVYMYKTCMFLINAICYMYMYLFVPCSAQGDVRVWDPRFTRSTHNFNAMSGSNVCTIHHSVPLLAWYVYIHLCKYEMCEPSPSLSPSLSLSLSFSPCSASNQAIKLYNIQNKELINSIRYHDGFMGQK